MIIETWIAFVAACLVFSSTPGVGILSTVNNAIYTSNKYTAFSILGLELTLAIYVLIVSVGLNAILTESLIVFTVIKWCGAAYLIWLGIQKLLYRSNLHGSFDAKITASPSKAIKTGMLINFSNPKSIIFLAAFFPQFISLGGNIVQQYLVLGITMIVIDALFHSLYAAFASKVKKHILNESNSVIINKLFGVMFIGAGLLMARANRLNA